MDHEEGFAAAGRRLRLTRQLVFNAAVHVKWLRVVLVLLHFVAVDRHGGGRGGGGGCCSSGGCRGSGGGGTGRHRVGVYGVDAGGICRIAGSCSGGGSGGRGRGSNHGGVV